MGDHTEISQSSKSPDRCLAAAGEWDRNPIFDELYQSYTKRISGGRKVSYKLAEAALFVLAALHQASLVTSPMLPFSQRYATSVRKATRDLHKRSSTLSN